MQISADSYYDESQFFDIRIMGSLGMTAEDIDAVSLVKGIGTVQGSYQTEAICTVDNYDYVLSVNATCEDLNLVGIVEGRIPQNATECFADTQFIKSTGYKIGDTITLASGTDEAITDTLAGDIFTIVGYGSYPAYLSWDRGTASIGNGSADAYLILSPESFTSDIYSVVYASVKDADKLNCYSQEYEEAVEAVMDRVEGLSDEQCDIRYNSIMTDGNSKIAEVESKITDAQDKLIEAQAKLEDAQNQITNATNELLAKEAELNNTENALNEQEATLNLAKQAGQVDEVLYAAGIEQITAARLQIKSGRQAIIEAQQELEDKQLELNQGKDEFATEKADADSKIADAQLELDDARQELEAVEYPKWYVLDRNSIQTFVEYQQLSLIHI